MAQLMPGYAVLVAPERAVSEPLWAALRARSEPASVAELHRASRAHPNAIQLRLRRWQRAGFLVALPGGERRYAAAPAARARPAPSGVNAALWAALLAGSATLADLVAADGRGAQAVTKQLRLWRRRGCVILTHGGPTRFAMTDIAPDVSKPPTVDPAGRVGLARTMRQRLWVAMRVLKRFDLPMLVIAAEATRRSAEDYINLLIRAGYLVNERRGNPMTGEWSLYCLVRRSGPLAPSVGHAKLEGRACRRLTDPNSGEVVIIRPIRSRSAGHAARFGLPAGINHAA